MSIKVHFVVTKRRDYRLKDRFERASETSMYWHNCSQDLLAAAAAVNFACDQDIEAKVVERAGLAPGFSLGIATPMVQRMLCGLAMELAFKAILVARRVKVPMHHDLSKLAKLATVDYGEDDHGLLAILSAAIMWNGRYPIPKSRAEWETMHRLVDKHLRRPKKMAGTNVQFSEWTYALNWEGLTRLYSKAYEAYWNAHRSEPDET